MDNFIEKWIESDSKLYDLICEIEDTGKPFHEMAELAFHRLSDLYNIPKMPSDIASSEEAEVADEKRSLFEEFTYLKYFSEEGEDLRPVVLLAAWNILNGMNVDLMRIAEKEFGTNIPEECQIAIRGEGINGEVVFPQNEGKSWYYLGCVKNSILFKEANKYLESTN